MTGREWNECRKKRRYNSRGEANKALAKIRRYGEKRAGGGMPNRCYFCPFCHGWHLTAKPRTS